MMVIREFKLLEGKEKEEWEIQQAKIGGDFDVLKEFGYVISCSKCGGHIIQKMEESTTYIVQHVKYELNDIVYDSASLQHGFFTEYRCSNSVCLNMSRNIDEFIKKI
jgi:hypothetical protein